MSDKSTLKKVCSRCGKEKHIDCFHKETRGLYGVRKICKECRQYLAKNKLSEKIEKEPIVVDGMKKCSKCGHVKTLDLFQNTTKNKLGYTAQCKDCINERAKVYIQTHPEIKFNCDKRYRDKNRDKITNRNREWRRRMDYCKSESFKKYAREYSKTPKGRSYYRDYANKYFKTEKGKEIQRTYFIKKMEEDVNFKLAFVCRRRVRDGLRSQSAEKKLHIDELVGCSFGFLRQWLESKFTEGMTWSNYGLYGWHIDHIIPVKEFDLTNIEQQKECFNYKNLQPLWAQDNLKKGAKIIVP